MTLDEAIQHCKDEAHVLFQHSAKHRTSAEDSCYECAKEHEQLAEWLTELKQRREAEISAPPKSNADRIRAMTDEELADVLQGQCACCAFQLTGCTEKECLDGAAEWLRKEADEMPITDRYGNALKKPEQKPTVQQSLDAWALLNELLVLGYPHNFQHEASHISGYLYNISALIDKAYEIKATEQPSLLDRLAAEYDRKHPSGLKFTYSLDGEVQQTEQEEKENE